MATIPHQIICLLQARDRDNVHKQIHIAPRPNAKEGMRSVQVEIMFHNLCDLTLMRDSLLKICVWRRAILYLKSCTRSQVLYPKLVPQFQHLVSHYSNDDRNPMQLMLFPPNSWWACVSFSFRFCFLNVYVPHLHVYREYLPKQNRKRKTEWKGNKINKAVCLFLMSSLGEIPGCFRSPPLCSDFAIKI